MGGLVCVLCVVMGDVLTLADEKTDADTRHVESI